MDRVTPQDHIDQGIDCLEQFANGGDPEELAAAEENFLSAQYALEDEADPPQ